MRVLVEEVFSGKSTFREEPFRLDHLAFWDGGQDSGTAVFLRTHRKISCVLEQVRAAHIRSTRIEFRADLSTPNC